MPEIGRMEMLTQELACRPKKAARPLFDIELWRCKNSGEITWRYEKLTENLVTRWLPQPQPSLPVEDRPAVLFREGV